MRLFIAVNFDPNTRNNILKVQERLRELDYQANFTRPENLHLTLAFLGEIPQNRVGDIQARMEKVHVEPMELHFDHVGCFKRDGGDVWWVGLRRNPVLERIQRELTDELTAGGFQLEKRSFQPHLTLARKVLLREQPDKERLLGKPFLAYSDRISLMLSWRKDGKLTYTELFERKAQ